MENLDLQSYASNKNIDFDTYKANLLGNDLESFGEYFLSHIFYGLHLKEDKWTLRVRNSAAKGIYILTEKNDFKEVEDLKLVKLSENDWELGFPKEMINIGEQYTLSVHYEDKIEIESPNLCLVKSYNSKLDKEVAVVSDISSFISKSEHFFSVNTYKKQKILEIDLKEINESTLCIESFVDKLISEKTKAVSIQNIFFEGSSLSSLSLNYELSNSSRWNKLITMLHERNILIFAEVNHFEKMPKEQVLKILKSNSESQFFLSSLNYFIDRLKLSGVVFNNIDNFLNISDEGGLHYEAKVFLMTLTELLNESNPLITIIAETYENDSKCFKNVEEGGLGFDMAIDRRLDAHRYYLETKCWDEELIEDILNCEKFRDIARKTISFLNPDIVSKLFSKNKKANSYDFSNAKLYLTAAKIFRNSGTASNQLISNNKLNLFESDIEKVVEDISSYAQFNLHYIKAKDKVLCIKHGSYLFVFNYGLEKHYDNYSIPSKGHKRARLMVSSNSKKYSGNSKLPDLQLYFSNKDNNIQIKLEPMSVSIIKLL